MIRWFRGLRPPVFRQRAAKRARRGPRNHCELPAPRTAPEDILRSLREVDPLYDVHYLGNGVWVIGRVVPNAVRRQIAGKIRRERGMVREVFSEHAIPELAYQGFGAVQTFNIQGECDYRVVLEAKEREWRYTNFPEQTFADRLEDSGGRKSGPLADIGLDSFWDEIEYRDRHITPELRRFRKHFPQGALHG